MFKLEITFLEIFYIWVTISQITVTTAIHYLRIRIILLTKITAAQDEVALSYHRVRGLYFLEVIFAATT